MEKKEETVRALYAALAGVLNALEVQGENINATKIAGDGSLGVKWSASQDSWLFWEAP